MTQFHISADVVRTRTGDQLHRSTVVVRDGVRGGTRSRTDCGCRVACLISRDVTVRPGLLCEKCFTPAFVENTRARPELLNVKLVTP